MFVRVGTFQIRPGTLGALRERYYAECAPLVKAAADRVREFFLGPPELHSYRIQQP